MLPAAFIRTLDFLNIHIRVDLFDELWPNNSVVGGAVTGQEVLSLLFGLVEELVDPLWVEEFIDTKIQLVDYCNLGS